MYSQKEKEKVFNSIIEDIEHGYSLRQVLRNGNNPSSRTFFKWLDEDELKVKQYARACDIRADSIFEDLIDIADDQENDTYLDKDGAEQTNHNVINRSRLRVDARKWMLSKMIPKKYGDSHQVKVTDGDGEPLKINAIFTNDVLSDDSPKEDS